MKYHALPLLVLLACSPLWAQSPESPGFRAGAATSNITPPLGQPIIGGWMPFPSTYVHDELHAKCIVLDDGHTRLALVVCDILGMHSSVSNEARRLIQEELGIPPERVMISATHTHSASSALGSDRFAIEGTLDDYQRFISRRIADGVACAVNNLRPAEMAFGTAEAPEHVFNRRWFLKEGTMPKNPFGKLDEVKMNPGANNPNLVKPAGPTDPTVSFIAFREPGGRPIAVFTSYSLHYVGYVGPGHISADYYAVYCNTLAKLLKAQDQDPPFVAVMSNGTSGDINNIPFGKKRPPRKRYEQIRIVAEDVATKVQTAMRDLSYTADVSLDARLRTPMIGWRPVSDEEMAWAKKTLAETEATPGKRNLPRIYAQRMLSLAEAPEASPLPLQVLRIGDVCIGTMPCEILCEIGLEFKERCPIQPAFLVSLAHGYLGYLPPPRQHDLGGYETWPGTNRLERNASEKMLSALLEMAAEMKPADAAK